MDPIDALIEIIDIHVPVDSPDYDLAMDALNNLDLAVDAIHNLIAMEE
jgi:hypothetical protein